MTKRNGLLALFFLVELTCFGRKRYTIPKTDFRQQLDAGISRNRIYCYKDDGTKVWLLYNQSTILTIEFPHNGKREVMLHTINYKNGIIEAVAYNVWGLTGKKIFSVSIDSVYSFYIDRKFQETELAYFNMDSSRNLVKAKNDSLGSNYLRRSEWMIRWVTKTNAKKDTLFIRENACYHLIFKDSNSTEFGVVQKITPDSIYISNTFNQDWAINNKKAYKVFGYSISDIAQLRLLKAGGFSYQQVKVEDYDIITTKADKDKLSWPYWFSINSSTGEVQFYRAWLAASGFMGIMEKEGKVYWDEGG